MENGTFMDDFPTETSIYKGSSMAMFDNQMVTFKDHFSKFFPMASPVPMEDLPTCTDPSAICSRSPMDDHDATW